VADKNTQDAKSKICDRAKGRSLITVVVCTYNQEAFIGRCLDSLAKQAPASLPFRILLIDNASSDRTVPIAKKHPLFSSHRCAIIVNKKNYRLSYACNQALQEIATPYYVRLDGDDYFSSDAMRCMEKEISAGPENDVIIFQHWDEWGAKRKKVCSKKGDLFSWIAAGTVFKTRAVKSVGGYSRQYWEEYDLYLKLLEKGCRFAVSARCFYHYRRGHASMTSDSRLKRNGLASLLKKWGAQVINKYGNSKRLFAYYAQKGESDGERQKRSSK